MFLASAFNHIDYVTRSRASLVSNRSLSRTIKSSTICYKRVITLFGLVGDTYLMAFEPRREKACLRGYRKGPTPTELYSLRLEMSDFGIRGTAQSMKRKQRH